MKLISLYSIIRIITQFIRTSQKSSICALEKKENQNLAPKSIYNTEKLESAALPGQIKEQPTNT